MDTTILEEQIKTLKEEQEKIQLDIINRTHDIEIAQHAIKFSQKRLKANEKELEFYEKLKTEKE